MPRSVQPVDEFYLSARRRRANRLQPLRCILGVTLECGSQKTFLCCHPRGYQPVNNNGFCGGGAPPHPPSGLQGADPWGSSSNTVDSESLLTEPTEENSGPPLPAHTAHSWRAPSGSRAHLQTRGCGFTGSSPHCSLWPDFPADTTPQPLTLLHVSVSETRPQDIL